MAQAHEYKTSIQLAVLLAGAYEELTRSERHWRYPAGNVLDTILDLTKGVRIQSLPDNEQDLVPQLQNHCVSVASLLREPTIAKDTISAECKEAFEQLIYLLELADLELAETLETLCPWGA